MSDFSLIEINDSLTREIIEETFGWTAGVLCFVILIPQLVHIWKIESANDLSIVFLALNEVCCMCYIIYGLIIGSLPIAVCDAGILVVNTLLIISKKILDKRNNEKQKISQGVEKEEYEKVKIDVEIEDKVEE